jgi:hypothetical protein
MKRLPENFPIILKDIDKVLTYDPEMEYKEIFTVYSKINKILKDNNGEVFDLNKVIKEYNTNNENLKLIKKLKKFNKLKNSMIATKALRDDKWQKFILKTYAETQLISNNNLNISDIENGILSIMKKYRKNWLGFWTIIKTADNGSINSIGLYDPKDEEKLLKILKKK